VELKAPIPEIDDIQLSAESHDALPHAHQSESVPLRNHAAVSCSASIVLDRQRQPTSLRCGQIPVSGPAVHRKHQDADSVGVAAQYASALGKTEASALRQMSPATRSAV
jgi:hypothetical protein